MLQHWFAVKLQNSFVDYKKWVDNAGLNFQMWVTLFFKMIELLLLDNWKTIEEDCKNNPHKAE